MVKVEKTYEFDPAKGSTEYNYEDVTKDKPGYGGMGAQVRAP